MRQGIVEKGANLGILALGRHRVLGAGRFRLFLGERTTLLDPLVAPPIEDLYLSVAEKSESPEGVAGPPVRFVAVEDAGGIARDPVFRANLGKSRGINVVADERILQVGTPIDVHGAGDVPSVIEED